MTDEASIDAPVDPNDLYAVPPAEQLDHDEPDDPSSGSHSGYPDHVDDVDEGDVVLLGSDD